MERRQDKLLDFPPLRWAVLTVFSHVLPERSHVTEQRAGVLEKLRSAW